MTIDKMRKSYQMSGLFEHEVHPNPVQQFQAWFGQANEGDVPAWLEINAMTLSTASRDGHVTSRIVLLKGIEAEQFIFFTNYQSSKGQQIADNASVALCFFWPHVERQIRICGRAEKSSRQASIQCFHSRPRGSQLGAHVSEQSTIITDRSSLEQTLQKLESQYAGQVIPCPEHWGGYHVTPSEFEFWQGRDNRLHDRILYRRNQAQWTVDRLAP
jgi:pyridoxamine 5'-phosphate oxidase